MKKWKIYRRQRFFAPGYPIPGKFEWYGSYNKGDYWFVADTFELLCSGIHRLYSKGLIS